MAESYTESFVFPFEGSVSQLKPQIESIPGVESVSVDTKHEEVDTELDCKIRYDTYQTDRTWIAEQIEEISGTKSVVFG